MQDYLVSIIVPCYNSQDFISKTLESVLKQSYTNWECILINDGSKDDTDEQLKKWAKIDDRFKYYYQENKGLSGARNLGLKVAQGDFVYFLDADDLMSNDAIESLLGLMNEEVDFVVGKTGVTYGQNNESKRVLEHRPITNKLHSNNDKKLLKLVIEQPLICIACNKLYKKEFIVKNKLDFVNKLLHEDELWFFETLFYSKNIILSDKITYYYNIKNPDSITNQFKVANVESYLQIIKIIYEKYFQEYKKENFIELISIYIIRLKTLTILHCYNKLNKTDQKTVAPMIKQNFNFFKPRREHKILNKGLEKWYYNFELLQILPLNYTLNFFLKKKQNNFLNKLKNKLIKQSALMLRLVTNKKINKVY